MSEADPRLSITSRSTPVVIVAAAGAEPSAEGGSFEAQADGSLQLRLAADRPSHHAGRIKVWCPPGSHVDVGTWSGDVELIGRFGRVRVVTASGRVEVDHADQVDIRSSSGRVHVRHCDGECRVVGRSSKVRIEQAGQADISLVSGQLDAGEVAGADVRTVTGRVVLGAAQGGHVTVRTVSGRVQVAVPDGAHPATSLRSVRGLIRCDCPEGHDGEVDVRTTSGAILVTPR